MTSRYRFYLDGILLGTDPRGWDDITFFVKRDKELNGLLVYIDVELEFVDDGYTYLVDKLYNDGFCETVTLTIYEQCRDNNYRLIHEGLILLSKLQIEEKACVAKVKPDDNSFYAKIDKNRSLSILPWVPLSKNNVEIDPAEREKIAFFDPATGIYYSHTLIADDYTCSGYRVYELLKYAIAFITDGSVDFDSTFFGVGGEQEFFCLTTGTVLFTVQTGLNQVAFEDSFPRELTFESLYKELYKKFNLGFYIDYSGLRPKLWIERARDINDGTDVVTLDAVYEVKTKVDNARLYSTVRFGSTTLEDVPPPALQFPEGIDWLGFKEEEYNILGNCGVDTTLDTVSDFIISSNVIENAVVTPSDAYEDQFAFIECRIFTSGANIATQLNNLTGANPPYFYNQTLINSEVAKRFLGAVPVSIARFLGNNDNTFLATMTDNRAEQGVAVGSVSEYGPLVFQNDFNAPNFDTSNNWSVDVPPTAGAARFVCPLTGIYTFSTTLIFQARTMTNEPWTTHPDCVFRIYDAGGTLLSSHLGGGIGHISVGVNGQVRSFTNSASLYMIAGQYMQLYFRYENLFALESQYYRVLAGSTLACVADVTGGGVYQEYEPKDYLGLLHEFDYNINNSQCEAIQGNPRGNIIFGQASQELRRAVIDTIRFNKNGISQLKLIRSINL